MTEDQKSLIQALVKHPWFAIVEELEKQESIRLGQSLIHADLSDEKQLKILRENQIYAKARRDFLENIRQATIDVSESWIQLF